MILIGQFDSPFVRRVGIALELYGMTYEHRPWSVWAEAEEIAAFNPLRRVPTLLLDDGEVLLESAAILDALDELAGGERVLIPGRGPERRAALRTVALAMGLADKSVSLLYEHVLRPDDAQSPTWVQRCQAQILDTLAYLERSCRDAGAAWWVREVPSHAGIAVTCALSFLVQAHRDLYQARDWPALEAHRLRSEALATFQRISQPLDVQL